MKEIPLPRGQIALVDDEDFERISVFGWTTDARRYVSCVVRPGDGTKKKVYLHRIVTNAQPGQLVDHINGDRFNNRRSNLRLCGYGQNFANIGPRSTNTSGFLGVSWVPRSQKWLAKIVVKGRPIHIGLFTDPSEAARARNEVAKKHWGEFAKLNQL